LIDHNVTATVWTPHEIQTSKKNSLCFDSGYMQKGTLEFLLRAALQYKHPVLYEWIIVFTQWSYRTYDMEDNKETKLWKQVNKK
jgi:hypothetical protein